MSSALTGGLGCRDQPGLNAAGQLEEFVQTTFGQWSVHGGSVDEYA
jgi:hypothetical protein